MNKHHLIKLRNWVFDPRAKTITKDDGSDESVSLENKQCLVLTFLVENHLEVITRDQLIDSVWSGRIVEELTINAVISRLRKMLGGEKNEFIKTHPKVGYSLICPIQFIEKELIIPDVIKLPKNIKPVSPPIISQEVKRPKAILIPKGVDIEDAVIEPGEARPGIIEPKIIIEPTFQGKNSRISKQLLIALFATSSCFLVFIFIWLISTQTVEKQLLKTNTKPTENIPSLTQLTPLTYIEGLELSPALSPDKTLLAFVHKKHASANMQVMVKNIKSNRIISLDASHYTNAPIWSPKGNFLYYQDYVNGKCLIKKIKVEKELTFSDITNITTCGNTLSMSPLAIKNNWLYFSYSQSEDQPFVIKKVHLVTKKELTLTSPRVKSYGDYSLSLSPDGSKIAFVRSVSFTRTDLMYLDLKTGEVKFLQKLNFLTHRIDWSLDSNSVVYVGINKTLNAINIESLEDKVLYRSSEKIFSPKIISNNEVLLIIGDAYTKNVKYLDTTEKLPKIKKLITSSFNDLDAVSYTNNKKEFIAFISNRSGQNQIWLSNNHEVSQVTNFIENDLITNLKFSYDGQSLIFIKSQQLSLLDLKTKKITKLTKENLLVKNAIWLYNSNEEIFISIHEQDDWNLYKVNTNDLKQVKILTGIDSIKTDRVSKKYYVIKSSSNNIYELDSTLKIKKNINWKIKKNFVDPLKWAVKDNQLYYLDILTKEVYKLDLLTNTKESLYEFHHYVYDFNLSNNKLIFNERISNNTYIAKVPIKTL
ncbi:winged helix-turn-helix domain-containing protein [Pseudoalteromonas denitrificans]|uniref:DNA-binding winged helix-turn-helix (WHTH) domain-containing protein n=1 Tax=Pseudoalteromonas denitrificans DSM 6059 TaxID=1123010 RepID=A0A1I1IXY6_9GAMM|nr:winged helix-turn-helix domain-containing protein [Pseudoalteromonas denitrificans]SFC38080.1 DNA-binding winged helix-turn-helix (wHTH) domain-containing protein [Pseudoalteromonas denitrificans DSM 6059]